MFLCARGWLPPMPLLGVLRCVTPFVCELCAGAVFLAVLTKLLCLRDPPAVVWCVGAIGLVAWPLMVWDAVVMLRPSATWAEHIAVMRAADANLQAILGIGMIVLALAGVILAMSVPRVDRLMRKALESRK